MTTCKQDNSKVDYGEIAQLVERGIEDPSVGGSIPSLPTNYTGVAQFGLERPVWARKVGSSNLSIRTIKILIDFY